MNNIATYSPDDNKLRIYPAARFDMDTFARLKQAGYKWAPKQELFVAPMWTPEREDIAIELADEIDDEDTSLVERAEQRAERFEGYSESRAAEADSAHKAVKAIADHIPFGQPILVGHHSERHARKDAERIDNGMRKSVKAWETSQYWARRAEGAIKAAKYKERPDVRARRIKGLESALRKMQRNADDVRKTLAAWESVKSHAFAFALAGFDRGAPVVRREGGSWWSSWDVLRPDGERYRDCPSLSWEEVRRIRIDDCNKYLRADGPAARWTAHYENRLAYERAMLAESGYKEPPKAPTKAALPLLNYDGEIRVRNPYNKGESETYTAHPMTKAEYADIPSDYKGTRVSEDGTHRVRIAMLRNPTRLTAVFLTDAKAHQKPTIDVDQEAAS